VCKQSLLLKCIVINGNDVILILNIVLVI